LKKGKYSLIIKRKRKENKMYNFTIFQKKEKEKIISDFRKLGIKLKSLNGIPLEVWTKIYNTLSDLFELYPEIPTGFLKEIIIGKGNEQPKYALISLNCIGNKSENNEQPGINLYLNKKEFRKNKEFFNIFIKEYNLTFPYTIEMAIAHEFGHIIEHLMYFKKYNWFDKTIIKEAEYKIVLEAMSDMEEICKPVMMKYLDDSSINYGETPVCTFIGEFLGSYASKDYAEAFAESMAQVYGNIENPLAKEIVEINSLYYKMNY
jgi:hypothetical protein